MKAVRSVVALSVLVALTSCGTATISASNPTPIRSAALARVRLKLTRVAKVSNATALAVHPTDDALYVATKAGRIVALGPGERSVLDLSADVTDFRDKPRFNEQGLLGIAFSPDGRQLYADFTDRDGDTTIRRYAFREGRADPSTAVDVLRIDQPGEYHLGGQTVFGPDGLLYIGVGDGGVRNGTTAQRLGTLLGKILRIAPTPTQRRPYRIPTDNPFVKISGARAEIFSYGLRNPWRFSFDRATGDLWIADVGENRWEEINFRPATRSGGENFGWAIYEGPDAEVSDRSPANLNTAGRHVFPVYAYPHPRPGCAAVVGGYVYRGSRIPRLAGAYVFGDLCDGRLRALRARAGRVIDQQMFDVHVPGITSFGEDHNGELYVLSLNAGVFRIDPA